MADENKFLKIKGGVVTGCDKSAIEIAIPEGVTKIGEKAFFKCKSLASITIPNGVTEIGFGAFESCKSLAGITIPNSVTRIGAYAFSLCKSLAEITIPDSVTEIGGYAFYMCKSLASITIPDSVTKIGEKAFVGCKSLADIRFGGTESQWEAIEKGEDWNKNVPASTVHCTDGETQLTGPVVSGTANESGPLTIEDGVVTGCDENARIMRYAGSERDVAEGPSSNVMAAIGFEASVREIIFVFQSLPLNNVQPKPHTSSA